MEEITQNKIEIDKKCEAMLKNTEDRMIRSNTHLTEDSEGQNKEVEKGETF